MFNARNFNLIKISRKRNKIIRLSCVNSAISLSTIDKSLLYLSTIGSEKRNLSPASNGAL